MGRKVVEVFDNTSSCMIEKLTSDDIAAFLSYTIRSLDQKLSTALDTEHEDGACSCRQLHPLQMFLSGVGGTGKSFLIHTIRAQIADIWKDTPDTAMTCAIAAPTGLAAFNINGVTVHRLFQLPVEHESKTSTYWPLPKDSVKIMRAGFKHVKFIYISLIIIDEVSMLSSLNLAYIHLRLEELFGGDQWFGGANVLFVGDILQLPPVNGSHVFQNVCNKVIAARLGCLASVNIWRETVSYDEFTINERQKKDSEFANLLNDVRVNCLSEKTIACLQRTVINCKPFEKFVELQASGQQFPVCLLATRKACDQFNSTMLDRAGSQVVKIACIDEYDETAGVKWTTKASAALEKLNHDCNNTAGLEAELTIAVGARVMLRRNIDTGRGLVNGALGCVSAISKDSIEVLFDHSPTSRVKIQRVKSKFRS